MPGFVPSVSDIYGLLAGFFMFETGQRGTNNNKFSPDRIPKAQINKHPANTS